MYDHGLSGVEGLCELWFLVGGTSTEDVVWHAAIVKGM